MDEWMAAAMAVYTAVEMEGGKVAKKAYLRAGELA